MNPYLAGHFAPVAVEVTAFELPVSGHVPAELNGRYLRNGPNPVSVDDPGSYHWLAGDAMVHGVRLRDGRAEWYRNRWVRTISVAKELGEQPRKGPIFAGMDYPPNTHVISHAGHTLALVEAGSRPYELTYELDTVGPYDFDGTLPGPFSGHTKCDPRTGELHAACYFWAHDHVQHVVIDRYGRRINLTEVPAPHHPLMHDFALTPNYAILYDLPVVFGLRDLMGGQAIPYQWEPEHGSRIALVPRGGGDIRWIDVPLCWIWHTLNAYEDGDRIVIDFIRHPRALVDGAFELDGFPTLDRWTVDPASGVVGEQRLDDTPQELPRINDNMVGVKHRYGYTTTTPEFSDLAELMARTGELFPDPAVFQHDLQTGTRQAHIFGQGHLVGEAVFVPSEVNGAENDGYVLTLVTDPDRRATDLVILAAQAFTEDPVAVVHLPVRVPTGFHGNWVPDMR